MKTQAIRALEEMGITHDVRAFDEEELSAEEAARKLGLPLEMVFKTLVLRGSSGAILLACVPGTRELSLRKLARASREKTVGMVGVEEIHKLTGYHRGGCSPLGARKKYPAFIDEEVILLDAVCVSAGMRGLQMILAPEDLIRAAEMTVADIAER